MQTSSNSKLELVFRMNFIYTSCLQHDFSSPGFPIDGCLYLSVLSGAVLGGETWKLRGFFLLYTTYVHQISNAPSRLECVSNMIMDSQLLFFARRLCIASIRNVLVSGLAQSLQPSSSQPSQSTVPCSSSVGSVTILISEK